MNTLNKLTPYMDLTTVISIMTEGNPGAAECIGLMFLDDAYDTALDLLLLDKLEIYGSKIYMLWNDCCGRDVQKMRKTISAFRNHKFTKEQIHENLSQVRAKPFIDENP